MKVIVDANIIFSGILNTQGKIGDLLLNSQGILDFIAADYMFSEVKSYYTKIQKITGNDLNNIERIHIHLIKNMDTFYIDQIPKDIWIDSYKVMKNIDPKDTPYFALSSHLNLKIWSGDKQLKKRLSDKKLDHVITTDELYELRKELKNK